MESEVGSMSESDEEIEKAPSVSDVSTSDYDSDDDDDSDDSDLGEFCYHHKAISFCSKYISSYVTCILMFKFLFCVCFR